MSRPRGAALVLCVGLALFAASASLGGEGPDVTARVTANQLLISLTLDPVSGEEDTTASARADVTNAGTQAMSGVSATLRFDSSGLVLPDAVTFAVGKLAPQQSATITWQICGHEPGLYVLLAQAQGSRTDGYELVIESEATLLTVSAPSARCG